MKSIQSIILEDNQLLNEYGEGGFTPEMKPKTKFSVAGHPVMFNGKWPDEDEYAFTLLIPGKETTMSFPLQNLKQELENWVQTMAYSPPIRQK
jgi:hypothetical protein